MDQNRIAIKNKPAKKTSKRVKHLVTSKKLVEVNIGSTNGLNLTLDNSLKKYANDPFFVEHARKVDQKFAKK